MPERGYRHFVVLLDLEKYSMSPAVTMWKTNLRSSSMTTQGQQQERNSLSCTKSFCHSWSGVAFDHWPTPRFNRALRRACLMTRLQACHRVFAPSRRDQDRERILKRPRLIALLHCLLPPLWSSWISAESPFRPSSKPF